MTDAVERSAPDSYSPGDAGVSTQQIAPVERIGLVLHPRRAVLPVLETVQRWTRQWEVDLIGLDGEIQGTGCDIEPVHRESFGERTDLVLGIGGDGTMLRALALAAPHHTPVLGVNLGRVAFLAEVDPPDLPAALDAVRSGSYAVESHGALAVSVPGRQGAWHAVAYNDVVLTRTPGRSQVAVAIYVDDALFTRYAADAVVVSTSTGSTAYNFSAGGPIVSPRIEAFLVTPVAPHAVFNRTLLTHPLERLHLEVLPESPPVVVEVDGRVSLEMQPGEHLHVRRSDRSGLLVRLGRTNFFQRARTKLHLGDAPALSS